MLRWLEVWTRQNLSRPDSLGGLMPAMGVAHLRDDGVVRPSATLMQANVGAVHHLDLAANGDDWEKAIKLAAQEVDPPLEHRCSATPRCSWGAASSAWRSSRPVQPLRSR